MNERTTKLLHELVSDGIVPGVSYTMLHNEEEQKEIFGNRQLEPVVKKLIPELKYDVASLTKVVGTTTVILKLVDEGRLAFDDKVIKYLPGFFDARVTIRHLLTHTSGITGYIKNRNELNAKQLLEALYTLHVGPTFENEVVYTDIGMIFLGLIIEKLYAKPVQRVITEIVLEPLKLENSTFTPLQSECVPTELTKKRGLIQGIVHDPKANILREHCGSAGLFMSMEDLVKFSRWLLSEGSRKKFFKTDMVNKLFKDQTPTHNLGRTYGWDLRYNQSNDPCIYHTGYTGTFILIDKKKQDALIVLTNRIHPHAPNNEFLLRRDQIITEYLSEKEI
ncbi:serine hydrolase domain-containing protein [Liquorilactobacillus hordei]|uniref:Beta-lactamase family protein n=1 Tax=Liquorilactobacillus hordei DSM 19519 TaxID=1423759 RepID=A0A0R1MVT4_9LACO|nr:serine hydrolase domain-containing protein [Liquorilactobacillus hordei]KRL08379.1 Beta-lactamase family protein [Liquorilactobacillus hordei DSM 19519]MBZ2404752.1 serine hydrolase [Liquorilactobacillus hordei]QYH52593.1 beta-lactamase family protein [Liquorilactobacillus hordei DSM 19519]